VRERADDAVARERATEGLDLYVRIASLETAWLDRASERELSRHWWTIERIASLGDRHTAFALCSAVYQDLQHVLSPTDHVLRNARELMQEGRRRQDAVGQSGEPGTQAVRPMRGESSADGGEDRPRWRSAGSG
jgi:hypothetical protein